MPKFLKKFSSLIGWIWSDRLNDSKLVFPNSDFDLNLFCRGTCAYTRGRDTREIDKNQWYCDKIFQYIKPTADIYSTFLQYFLCKSIWTPINASLLLFFWHRIFKFYICALYQYLFSSILVPLITYDVTYHVTYMT